MIRLAEDVVAEIQRRHCPPGETYVFGLSLQMWPVFQKGMTEHVESLKKLADGTSVSYFSRASTTTTDAKVTSVSVTYFYAIMGYNFVFRSVNSILLYSTLLST